VSDARIKLTTYFGEHDRIEGVAVADALLEAYARHGVATSLLLRGTMGFGARHRLRTDRLLTLSEDLPLVSVAVDEQATIDAVLPEVIALHRKGLVTLERARRAGDAVPSGEPAAKLTVYLGRGQRIAGRPAHVAVTDLLHRLGVAGATVLLGVDGTTGGIRTRASFVGPNTRVPVMVIAVGGQASIDEALGALAALAPDAATTVERVAILKRDGALLAEPAALPATDAAGLALWQKLTVFCSEASRGPHGALHAELVRELRRAGAAGATALRGVRGYHGDHRPHGDRLWQLERRVPVLTVLVDEPGRTRRWFELVDALTATTGLVTAETVPALRVTGPAPALADPPG
jgi:PII-like signaling protein